MRLGQSAADADTLTRARPLATSTESVSCHTEENLGVDQWYKIMHTQVPYVGSTIYGTGSRRRRRPHLWGAAPRPSGCAMGRLALRSATAGLLAVSLAAAEL